MNVIHTLQRENKEPAHFLRDSTGSKKLPGKDLNDPHFKPTYSFQNRLQRLLWQVVHRCFYQSTPRPFYSWRAWLLRLFGAKLGKYNKFYPSSTVWAPWLLKTGDYVTVADGVEIYNPGGVYLEDRVLISQGAWLCGASHDYNDILFPTVAKPITLKSHCWICARAIVLLGVTVGEGAVLAAASVATKNLDPWTVYAGNPANRVKERHRPQVTI